MDNKPIVNKEAKLLLTPVNEFIAIIQKRYNQSPNSLSAGGFREVLKMAEQFITAEASFTNAAYTAGYEQAINDLRNVKKVEPQNEESSNE